MSNNIIASPNFKWHGEGKGIYIDDTVSNNKKEIETPSNLSKIYTPPLQELKSQKNDNNTFPKREKHIGEIIKEEMLGKEISEYESQKVLFEDYNFFNEKSKIVPLQVSWHLNTFFEYCIENNIIKNILSSFYTDKRSVNKIKSYVIHLYERSVLDNDHFEEYLSVLEDTYINNKKLVRTLNTIKEEIHHLKDLETKINNSKKNNKTPKFPELYLENKR